MGIVLHLFSFHENVHTKNRLFDELTVLHHLNTKLVCYSDPLCIWKIWHSVLIWIKNHHILRCKKCPNRLIQNISAWVIVWNISPSSLNIFLKFNIFEISCLAVPVSIHSYESFFSNNGLVFVSNQQGCLFFYLEFYS